MATRLFSAAAVCFLGGDAFTHRLVIGRNEGGGVRRKPLLSSLNSHEPSPLSDGPNVPTLDGRSREGDGLSRRFGASRRDSVLNALKGAAVLSVGCNCLHGEEALADPSWTYADQGKGWTGGVCQTGLMQSPIYFDPKQVKQGTKDMDVQFHYQKWIDYDKFKFTNTGRTVKMDVVGELKLDGDTYKADHLHFHSPAEHLFREGGRPSRRDLECHIVHKNEAGNLAVVGITFVNAASEKGELQRSRFLQGFLEVDQFPPQKTGDQNALVLTKKEVKDWIDLNWYLLFDFTKPPPSKTGYQSEIALGATNNWYRYTGSLTTPPCSEGVKWIVLKDPVPATADQIEDFLEILKPKEDTSLGSFRDPMNALGTKRNTSPIYKVSMSNFRFDSWTNDPDSINSPLEPVINSKFLGRQVEP
uniref:carbonic anhydrase n=1 Tax=Chromera velia CCMP2878 TaxID=1169474 RepID=A0A0K6S969_9ALVE|mmetsp:Transcript_44296/g.87438  ORF Transcript_44296/g.87438 Transcript_44296/m.87438 type:complete len:416 (+) Transcript_44296:160-1407(+)|eukprot:Cvel_27384.t1-p1 / transcript=Cvel_27384.t1 / gene=Cvel_27384 / organism=Chromera_velia_CCMP2878 / gene_product=Carbonic anhydrase, putative / transcript_product=Carbonic anhydrase, putative / location=Cvel_scaffold3408:10573-15481(+) / protein_length=415 / sequence_SO=supercontig / SO=protein_coding / is_pseudo=false